MRTLYLDCGMGAAGDMLMAALLELVDDKAAFLEKMNGLGLPGVAVSAVPAVKCGITGTHVAVTVHGEEEVSCDVSPEGHIHHHDRSHEHGHEHSHEHEHGHEHEHHHHDHDHGHHHHTGMGEIRHLLGHLELPEAVRADAEAVYGLIAEAESHAHGAPVEEIHFHEVGSLDAVADVGLPAGAHAGCGAYRGLPGTRWKRPGALRPWHPARARPRHSPHSPGRAHLRRSHPW